jgi:hypothetical protein
VDTFQLAVFHGLMVSKEQHIYGSDDDDERNACAIQRFAGILAKQLLLMGEECKRNRRKRRRFELRGGRTHLFSDESDDFLSSQESSSSTFGGFAVLDGEANQFEEESSKEESRKKEGISAATRVDMNGDKKEEGDGEIKKENEEEDCFLASFTDRLGERHDAFKYRQRVQSTNGKKYTPAKRCSRIGCKCRSRVYCKQCKEPFCYKLVKNVDGMDEDDEEISCFQHHITNIKRSSNRRMI